MPIFSPLLPKTPFAYTGMGLSSVSAAKHLCTKTSRTAASAQTSAPEPGGARAGTIYSQIGVDAPPETNLTGVHRMVLLGIVDAPNALDAHAPCPAMAQG